MTMADASNIHCTLLETIEDQMGFMALNAIGSGKLCAHPVCFGEFGDEPERFMQRPLVGHGLLLPELMQALPVDDLQIV